MKVLLLGSGGREHALARGLAGDPFVSEILCAPGNPGTAECGTNIPLDPTDPGAVARLAAAEAVDLVVVGPEAPLVAGVVDELLSRGIAAFGPTREAARLEGSKSFAKEIMAAAGVPTAMARLATTAEEVAEAMDWFGAPYVIKDDGLAAGKGVVVTSSRAAALAHAAACLAKGGEKPTVVVEEYLDGPEVSLFCLSDGAHVVPLAPAQDFKRAYDGGAGPNTGGMGAYSPLPWLPEGFTQEVVERVAEPVIREMALRGTPFVGVLYCGLALTSRGLRVIEFNCRFGDPETQVVIPRLRTPLGALLHQCATGGLRDAETRWKPGGAVGIVLAAPGYPGEVQLGGEIDLGAAASEPGVHLVHAGTAYDGALRAAGGRVLTVVGEGEDVAAARAAAYRAIAQISLDGAHYRSDIGQSNG